jgi:hypothetical protein
MHTKPLRKPRKWRRSPAHYRAFLGSWRAYNAGGQCAIQKLLLILTLHGSYSYPSNAMVVKAAGK